MLLHSSSTFSPQPTKDFFFFSPLLKQQLTRFSTNGSRCNLPLARWQGFVRSGCASAKRRVQVLQRNKALVKRIEERPWSEKQAKNATTILLIEMVTAKSQHTRRLRLQDGAALGHQACPAASHRNLPSGAGSTGQQWWQPALAHLPCCHLPQFHDSHALVPAPKKLKGKLRFFLN